MKISVYGMALGALMLGASAGNAATVTCSTPQGTALTLTAASACVGLGGNDDVLAIEGLAAGLGSGATDWMLADKNDDISSGDQSITFGDEFVNGGTTGDWSISEFPIMTDLILVLKAGNGFVAFLLDPSDIFGTWSSDSRDLSHASLYYAEDLVADVPVPAAGLLMVTALGGGFAMRRRKKS